VLFTPVLCRVFNPAPIPQCSYNDFEEKTLKEVIKFYYYYQLYSSTPRRFKFTLKDDYSFNYKILVDVIYLSSKLVLHVVDSLTAF
jgi:hypothetical protein